MRIRLRGRDVTARPDLVGSTDEVERLLGVMATQNPALERFVRIPKSPDGHLDRAKLTAVLEHGFRIVRWRLDNGT